MINQLQQHIVATFGTKQRVLAKAFEEALCKGLWRQYIISSGVVGDVRGKDFSKIFSGLFIAYIAMKPVVSDSLETLWQDMLDHASDEFEDGQPFMFDLFGFMVMIPVLPFSVEQFVGDVRERFPFSFWVDAAGSHEDMKVRVVMAGPAGSLQNDNVADVKIDTGIVPQDILQTGMTCPHEWAEQIAIAIEPSVKEIRHGQDDMSVCYTGHEPSSDVIGPSVCVNFGTRQVEAGFTCEGDAAGFSTRWATVSDKTHLFWIAAVQHFLQCLVVFWVVVTRMDLLEPIPVVLKNTLKGVLANAFHGHLLRTTIAELT